jgi:hypothetical protein
MISFQNIPSALMPSSRLLATSRRSETESQGDCSSSSVCVCASCSLGRSAISLQMYNTSNYSHYYSVSFRLVAFSLFSHSAIFLVVITCHTTQQLRDRQSICLFPGRTLASSNHRNRKLANQINFQDLARRRFIVR